jgi:hypothetical protein
MTDNSKSEAATNYQTDDFGKASMPSYTGIVHYVFWYQLLYTLEPEQIQKPIAPFKHGRIWS